MEEDENRSGADGFGPKHEDRQMVQKRMSQQVTASHTPNLNYQKKKNLVELRESLIDDIASSEKCLLLGVSETLRLLSLHLFSGLCVRVLNSEFSSGTSETLPSRPCLCLCLSPM